jgi:hypothetical protein
MDANNDNLNAIPVVDFCNDSNALINSDLTSISLTKRLAQSLL